MLRITRLNFTGYIIWLNQMCFTKKVDEVGALSGEIETDIETPSPEDGKSNDKDRTNTETNVDSHNDSEKDRIVNNIDEEADGRKSAEAYSNDDHSDGGSWTTATTGRQTCISVRYRQKINASALVSLCCEGNYHKFIIDEDDKAGDNDDQYIACVGSGLVGGFENIKDLHVIKYKEAMKSKDKGNWDEAVFEEHERMVKRKVWKSESRKEVPT
jgi:hypothetical protein